MNQVLHLLNSLAPGGVEFARLGDVIRIKNGRDYKHLGAGDVPVYGTGGVMTHVDTAAHTGPSVLIPRKGSLSKLYFVDRPFWTVDTIFYSEVGERVEAKFIYYYLLTLRLEEMNKAGGVPSLTQSELNQLAVPVPPLDVQREIVRILDNFTKLETELEAELEARRQQYAHYSRVILDRVSEGATTRELGSIVTHLRTGLNPRQNFVLNPPGATGYYATVRELHGFEVRFTDKTDRLDEAGLAAINNRSRLRAGDVLFSATGTIGRTALVATDPVDWNIKEGVYALTPDPALIDSKYLIYSLRSRAVRDEVLSRSAGSTVQSIPMAELRKVQISVPSLAAQRSAVVALDSFDALVSDVTIGLPAELAARRKQYEYYRDKLLTFEEAPA